MKLAILGGTFNPPHIGHLAIAESVLKDTDYDTVVFVPTNIPAHKLVDTDVSAQRRLEMVGLTCRGNDHFMFDACDIERGGMSFSIETVHDIRCKYGIDGVPGFVVGDDLLDGFSSWRRVDELVATVELLVARRLGRDRHPFHYPHRHLNNEIVPVSSQSIRKLIALGEPIRGLVPDKVEAYIAAHGLYAD